MALYSFSSNMELLGKALSPDMLKFKSKGVTSVKSRVTNIAEHLSEKMTVETFMDKTNQHILDKFPGSKTYTFSDEDLEAIKKIETNRFANWEWNYGASPKYNFMNQEKFPGGLVEINLEVKNSLIKSAKIYGDFFSQGDISEVEKALVGVKHETESVKQASAPLISINTCQALDLMKCFNFLTKNTLFMTIGGSDD